MHPNNRILQSERKWPPCVSNRAEPNQDLYNAWSRKETVYKFVDCITEKDARQKLLQFFLYAGNLKTGEQEDCLRVYGNWSTEILHSIQSVYTAIFKEGMNNNLKVLKRTA